MASAREAATPSTELVCGGHDRQDAEQGRTVLFATHYLEEADAYADRIILMRQGEIVAWTPRARKSWKPSSAHYPHPDPPDPPGPALL